MKTIKNFIYTAFCVSALFLSACDNNTPAVQEGNNNENEITNENESTTTPKKGALVYSLEDPCGGLYFDEKLGDDFETALQNLIASRRELSALGENLYVKQTEISYLKTDDDSKVLLLQFFEKDDNDKEFPLKVLSAAHDAIDTNGNHYDVEFCDGPSNTDDLKPEGSYSYEECSSCYLVLVKNYGRDFESAYRNLKPEIDAEMAKLSEEYKGLVTYKSDDVIEKQSPITVTNCEIKDIKFTMISIYMYSTVSEEHIHIKDFGALDSNGNFYARESTPVFDTMD